MRHFRHAEPCGRFVMALRIIAQLARKHVRQHERDHPGYDIEAQEYFGSSVGPNAHGSL
jgi:hypothetical protein